MSLTTKNCRATLPVKQERHGPVAQNKDRKNVIVSLIL